MSSEMKFELPECGILVGQAVYNICAGYLGGSGYAYTNWQPDSTTPLELVDLTVKEKQGNLIQFWWFDGGGRPQTKANYLALEDIGVTIPPPDWDNGKNISIDEFPEIREHLRDRGGAGVIKALEKCRENGLYSTMIYCTMQPEYVKKLSSLGDSYIGYDFGEKFTFRLKSGPETEDTRSISLSEAAEHFRDRVSAYINGLKQDGWGRIFCTSSNFYMDYEVAAGVDVTLYEDCCNELNFMSSLSRGLCRQYDRPFWGSHIANEHYQWLPFSNPHRFETLRSQMFLKYIAGAKIIISESGAWHVQTSADESPQTLTPRIKTVIGKSDTALSIPLVHEAEKLFPQLDHNSKYCRNYRRIMADFYEYVLKNGTPQGQPQTTLAVAKGNYDLSSIGFRAAANHSEAIAGMYDYADRNPNWKQCEPEEGWEIVRKVFFPNPQGIYGCRILNRLFSGTPYGQVDIVSFAFDQPTADFLLKQYKVLIFAGWNTCSDKQYAVLTDYVKGGGRLFISIPQLSTDTYRNFRAYTKDILVKQGDFSELCGVKVRGRGPRFFWGTAPTFEKNCLGVNIHRRYGVFGESLGDIELTDEEHTETLLFDHETLTPLLLRRKLGKGEVYFLNSWAYPGTYSQEFGPLAEPDDAGMIGDVFKYLARLARTDVYITEAEGDEPGEECRYVAYSHFPDCGVTCLFNIDFEKPHTIALHRFGKTEVITLNAQEIRQIR